MENLVSISDCSGDRFSQFLVTLPCAPIREKTIVIAASKSLYMNAQKGAEGLNLALFIYRALVVQKTFPSLKMRQWKHEKIQYDNLAAHVWI